MEPEQHCWADVFDGLADGSAEYRRAERTYRHGAVCMLADGHEGPHEWTATEDVMVEFTEVEND